MPEHTLGHERGPPEKGEGDKDEAREGDELELENRHEDLHRENEEGEHDDDPGDEQDHDLEKVGEEPDGSEKIGAGVEQRFGGIEIGRASCRARVCKYV